MPVKIANKLDQSQSKSSCEDFLSAGEGGLILGLRQFFGACAV
jgi:hypothetical protein